MTDPQNDVSCRDCKRPTQHATEICDDCRTPAGRILTALAARGIKGDKIDKFDVLVGQVLVSADGLSWCLMCEDGVNDHDDNIEAAANAIAAIVQAPKLRAEVAALKKPTAPKWILIAPDCAEDVLDDEAEARAAFEEQADMLREDSADDGWHESAETLALYAAFPVLTFRLDKTALASDDTEDGERCRDAGWDFIAEGVTVEHGTPDVTALRAERDTLAAEVKRLTERLEVFAGALLSLGAT